MAVTQMTDTRVTVEPEITTQEYQFGPSDSVAANAVMLTSASLRNLGAYPPKAGQQWDCHLWIYWTVDGVETAKDLSGLTLGASYWDPVTLSAATFTAAHGAGDGQITISTDDPTAGLYRFAVVATDTDDTFDICSGWIEIEPARPTA